MLYNHEIDLTTTEERIKKSNISNANKKLIFEFESYCFAGGLSLARILKHLYELKIVAEMLNKDFKSISKADMMKLLERIERMDRSETTKHDLKS